MKPNNYGSVQELTFPNGTDVIFSGDGPFMAVQYLIGAFAVDPDPADPNGDPSMYQMIPTEGFLKKYAFATGENTPNGSEYEQHYVQVIRPVGAPDIFIDDVMVADYKTVGGFEVANVLVEQGQHFAESTEAFGLVSIGYGSFVSYAFPSGFAKRVPNNSELVVNKVASADEVGVGDPLTYTITVENTGNQDEPNLIVADQVPAELTIDSVVPGDPTCTVNNNLVLCQLGELPVGESTSVTINTTVNAIPDNNLLTNTAIASGDKNNPDNNDDGVDGDPSDNKGGTSTSETTEVRVTPGADDGGDDGDDDGGDATGKYLQGSGCRLSQTALPTTGLIFLGFAGLAWAIWNRREKVIIKK